MAVHRRFPARGGGVGHRAPAASVVRGARVAPMTATTRINGLVAPGFEAVRAEFERNLARAMLALTNTPHALIKKVFWPWSLLRKSLGCASQGRSAGRAGVLLVRLRSARARHRLRLEPTRVRGSGCGRLHRVRRPRRPPRLRVRHEQAGFLADRRSAREGPARRGVPRAGATHRQASCCRDGRGLEAPW